MLSGTRKYSSCVTNKVLDRKPILKFSRTARPHRCRKFSASRGQKLKYVALAANTHSSSIDIFFEEVEHNLIPTLSAIKKKCSRIQVASLTDKRERRRSLSDLFAIKIHRSGEHYPRTLINQLGPVNRAVLTDMLYFDISIRSRRQRELLPNKVDFCDIFYGNGGPRPTTTSNFERESLSILVLKIMPLR